MLLAGLSGCVAAPSAPPMPAPLVAVPGPTKTTAEFQQDDIACRAAAAEPPPDLKPAPAALQPPAGSNAASKDAPAPTRLESSPRPATSLGVTYLRCMNSRYNIIEPLSASQPITYGYYPAYPVYGGSSDYYPWLYGGFYDGFCCGVGFGFGRGYYGHGYYGGRGYGGGRFGGGYHGGGFHGGGFHGGGFGGGGRH